MRLDARTILEDLVARVITSRVLVLGRVVFSRRRAPRRVRRRRRADGLVVRDAALVETRAHHHLHELLGLLRRRQGRRGRRPGHVQLNVLGPPFWSAVPRVHVVDRHGVAVSHSIQIREVARLVRHRAVVVAEVNRLVAAGAQRAPGLVGRRPGLVGHPGDRCADGVAVVPRSLRRGPWRLWQGQPHTGPHAWSRSAAVITPMQ